MPRTADDDQPEARPLLRVVRGDATPEEIAALVAVLAARGGGEVSSPPRSVKNTWSDRSRLLRRPLATGPGAWRASGLPGYFSDAPSSQVTSRQSLSNDGEFSRAIFR